MTQKVKCEDAWTYEPRLVLDKEYEFVSRYFSNGEGHLIVADEHGRFDAPEVFFSEPQ